MTTTGKLPKQATGPILRWKQVSGVRTAVVLLNEESGAEGLVSPPDEAPLNWWEMLRKGDVVSALIREESRKFSNTFIGKCLDPEKQPNKLKTTVRNRERGHEELRRSDLILPPRYAEALQKARRLAGDPDTATWASRLVMAHLTPFLSEEN